MRVWYDVKEANILDLFQRPVFNYVLIVACTGYTEEQLIKLHASKFSHLLDYFEDLDYLS